MKAVLIRTGSSPLHNSSSSLLIHGSPKVSMSYHDSVTGILFSGKNDMNSPGSKCLHFEIKQKNNKNNLSSRSIRRAYSESDMFGSVDTGYGLSRMRSRSFPAIIPEEDEDVCDEDGDLKGSVMLKSNEDLSNELDFFSGGGIGTKFSGGNGGGGDEIGGDKSKIGANYVEMLKMDPGNSLLLRNYGKFLHEVEKNAMKAEEYYSRAILANPGDGEVLSLYGKLIWETQKDRTRAKSYFDRSIQVAPSDCFVMGAYAHFLWDTELDEGEEEEETGVTNITTSSSAMVEAF